MNQRTRNNELKQDFDEQYAILKQEEIREENKKTIILIVLCFLTLVASVFGATFSYYNSKVSGNDSAEPITIRSNKALSIVYTDGAKLDINGDIAYDVIPGWKSSTKTFTIKNTGDANIIYNLYWDKVKNEFERTQDLVLTLKRNGEVLLDQVTAPTINSEMVKNLSIAPKAEDTYEMVFEYLDSKENQDVDKNKLFISVIQVAIDNAVQ